MSENHAPNELLLSARNVSKSYVMGKRSLEVLRRVSLDVARGEFLALRGASGAGKSTLLHLFGGLDSPNAGEIWFAGKNLAHASEAELTQLRNAKVGFIFQAYHLLPELDALENVCVPARLARVPAATAAKRGRDLLQRVGLGARLDHKPYELSGGEQQRVAIARALMNEPELILADEPTGNLDSYTGHEIVDLLVSLRAERNTTLIIATHDANVAARAPKTIQLVDGQIQAAATN
jgi:ABC-type lipoprotein export system ATPase subunit